MTDKQIEDFIYADGTNEEENFESFINSFDDTDEVYYRGKHYIKNMKNKLLRKEQEYERLDNEAQNLFTEKTNLEIEISRLKTENEALKKAIEYDSRYNDMQAEIDCGERMINQLKAENEKYSLFIEKLCDYAGLECDSEEQAMRTLSDLASQMNKAIWIVDRYKQTLTEIKKIAHKINDECELEGFGSCALKYKEQILQKISEVIE